MLKNYSPPNSNACPKCHSDQAPNILVCTMCGYNFRVTIYTGIIDEQPAPLHWYQQPLSVTLGKARRFFSTTGGALIILFVLCSAWFLCAIIRAASPPPPTITYSDSVGRSVAPEAEQAALTPPNQTAPYNAESGGDVEIVLSSLHADLMRGELHGAIINRSSREHRKCVICYDLCNDSGNTIASTSTEIEFLLPGATYNFVCPARVNYTTYRLAYIKCYD